ATEEFHGFAASRRNYDVAQGIDADGWPQSGVLEPSWHVGGASSAELAKDGFHYGACRAAPRHHLGLFPSGRAAPMSTTSARSRAFRSPMAAARRLPMCSEARRSGSASKWAYRAVVDGCVCPSNLPMIGRPKPNPAPTLAWVWRRSWMRSPLRPARFTIARHGRLRSDRGLSSLMPAAWPAIT